MSENDEAEHLLSMNQQLLNAIADGDWETYKRLCDPSLTAFEPEARGHLVEGMEFHRFYFDRGGVAAESNTTMADVRVRFVGERVAVVTCVRLIQKVGTDWAAVTLAFEETRVWEKQSEGWQHVHFHRSLPSS